MRPTDVPSKKAWETRQKRVALARRFLVDGKVKFWFERHPPTRTDAPVLLVLQKVVLEEKSNPG
jgi:hypothetical protein